MISWNSISLKELNLHIDLTIHLLSEEEKSFWNFIKIEPEKWICPNYGTYSVSVEFFVIGIFGHRVILYNDIEDGFNISKFKQYGILEDGGANQNNDFHDYISRLYTFFSSGKP